MNKAGFFIVLAGAVLLASILWRGNQAEALSADRATPAPEFTHSRPDQWINSAPLKLAQLRGKVVMLDIWTFECWNCYRSFPWLHGVEQRFADSPFTVIGVHTPEFDRERVRASIVAKAREFKLEHPIMIDNDFSYWNALGNRYWPTYYLIDKQGRLRARFVGETHAGTDRGNAIEAKIAELLAEAD